MARVLVVGDDGRAAAIIEALRRSQQVQQIHCAPGNRLVKAIDVHVGIAPHNIKALIRYAKAQRIDLTVVSSETQLAAGIVDDFTAGELRIFGPTQAAARLESSKVFCKCLLRDHNIPTAKFDFFDDVDKAKHYAHGQDLPFVIKVDGLAAGKGVTIAQTYKQADLAIEEALTERKFGDASCPILIEAFVEGQEYSLIAITNGHDIIMLEPARDYKQVSKIDPRMTGGVAAYSPVLHAPPDRITWAKHQIFEPTLSALRANGIIYRGALYAGMKGSSILEFNCRFGDPEAQVILPRLESDFYELLFAATCDDDSLATYNAIWDPNPSVCVVMASEGYPGEPITGRNVYGLEAAEQCNDATIYYANIKRGDPLPMTTGGRVLGVGAKGSDLAQARQRAYRIVHEVISFEGAWWRNDIGQEE